MCRTVYVRGSLLEFGTLVWKGILYFKLEPQKHTGQSQAHADGELTSGEQGSITAHKHCKHCVLPFAMTAQAYFG